jgi:glycosyltransferase involved in cell wall biosynthesis
VTTQSPVEEPQRPILGFIGIHSGGRPDQAVSQNETLAALFTTIGYEVRQASTVKRPSLRTAHQILALLSWRDVDVIVVAVFSGPSFWIAEFSGLLGRLTGKRVVFFLHGGNLPVFGPQHRRRVERVFDRADLILAPSDSLATAFQRWGYDVRVIPNVLAIENYDFRLRTAPAPRLLWMRTFHQHYNPQMAVRTFARVVEHHPDATMTMAGADHGELGATRAEADRLGVADRIAFPGYLDLEGKRAAFGHHDVYLNTNIVDNMPVSLLEAAASGLVPVATAVGGIPVLLTDGENGILVASDDDVAMADSVVRLLADAARFADLSAGARRLAESSAWSQVQRLWARELALIVPERRVP